MVFRSIPSLVSVFHQRMDETRDDISRRSAAHFYYTRRNAVTFLSLSLSLSLLLGEKQGACACVCVCVRVNTFKSGE